MIVLLAFLAAGLVSCVKPVKSGTSPATYTVTVTGTSGSTTKTGSFTLNVFN